MSKAQPHLIPWEPYVQDTNGDWITMEDTVELIRGAYKGRLAEVSEFIFEPNVKEEVIEVKIKVIRIGPPWGNSSRLCPNGVRLAKKGTLNQR